MDKKILYECDDYIVSRLMHYKGKPFFVEHLNEETYPKSLSKEYGVDCCEITSFKNKHIFGDNANELFTLVEQELKDNPAFDEVVND